MKSQIQTLTESILKRYPRYRLSLKNQINVILCSSVFVFQLIPALVLENDGIRFSSSALAQSEAGCYYLHSVVRSQDAAWDVIEDIRSEYGYDAWDSRTGSILKGDIRYRVYYSQGNRDSARDYCGESELSRIGSNNRRSPSNPSGLRPGLGGSTGDGCWWDPETGASVCS